MMYHFMFGLRGASVAVAVASAEGGAIVSPLCASFFGSSNIIYVASSGRSRLVSSEKAKQRRYAFVDDEIDNPKVRGEDEYGDDDHRGRPANFLPARRRHLAHFGAHVVVEGLDLVRPRLHPVPEAATGCYD